MKAEQRFAEGKTVGYRLPVPTVTLKAHFDGERIVLDEKYDLPPHTPLMVTLLPPEICMDEISEEEWLRFLSKSESYAFLADPREDIYTLEDGVPYNHEECAG